MKLRVTFAFPPGVQNDLIPEWGWGRVVVNSSLTECLKLEGFFCLCVPHLTYIERTLVTVDLRSIINDMSMCPELTLEIMQNIVQTF